MKTTRPLIPHKDVFQHGDHTASSKEVTAEGNGFVGCLVLASGWVRPVNQDNWIAFSERQPTAADALDGKVIFFSGKIDGFSPSVQNWNYAPLSESYRKYWMPINFTPREASRVKVDGHEVVPQKDGSIKVGCQTVSAKDFEEILRQRKEVMS